MVGRRVGRWVGGGDGLAGGFKVVGDVVIDADDLFFMFIEDNVFG